MPRRRESTLPTRANLTPLIDVVFLLIIFFLLVAQISRQRSVDLELPALDDPIAHDANIERRAVVNVAPEEQIERLGGDYRLGANAYTNTPAGLARLTADLRAAISRDPETRVLLRAARDEHYDRVYPALEAIARADIADAELVLLEGVNR